MPASTNQEFTNAESILRPQTRLDIIFNMDLLQNRADVRSSMLLDLTDDLIIVAQTAAPIMKSMIGRTVEATCIRRDALTGKIARWGWEAEISGLSNDYKLSQENIGEEEQELLSVVFLTPPKDGLLKRTNARLAYRLAVGSNEKINIQTHPSFGRITLMDFSVGGALIAIPVPPQAKPGLMLWFTLLFSGLGEENLITVNGEAEVVRVDYAPGDRQAKAGLRFLNLSLNDSRSLQRAVNHYMLQEQRNRHRRS